MECYPAIAGLSGRHPCCFPAVPWHQSWELRVGDLRYTYIVEFTTNHESYSSVPVSLSKVI